MAGKDTVIKNVKIIVSDNGQLKIAAKDIDRVNAAMGRNVKATKAVSKSSAEYDRNMKGNSQMSANASKNFSKQAQGMQGVLVPAYAEVAARVFALSAAYGALTRAADFQILQQGQELYAQKTGKNLSLIAKQLQEAAGYMIDFQQASEAAAFGTTAGLRTDQLIDITKAARGSAAALGRTLPDAFDRLTRGIIKGEPEILDELGIIIRLDNVYKEYAKTLNKTANQLTEFQKLQARTTAVTGQALQKYGDIGEGVDINSFARLQSAAFDTIKELSGVLNVLFAPLANFLVDFKGAMYLLFAFIAKSLIGKVFPAFKTLGASIQALPGKFNARIEAGQKLLEEGRKTEASYQQQIFGRAKKIEGVYNRLSKMKFRKNSLVGKFLASGGGEKELQALAKRATSIERVAKASAKDGVSTATGYRGESIKDIEDTTQAIKDAAASQEKWNEKARRWSKIAGLGSTKMSNGILRLLLPALQKAGAAIDWITVKMTKLFSIANFAMIGLAIVQTIAFIGDWIAGLNNQYSKAIEAAREFADSSAQTLKSVLTTDVELDPANLVGSFDKMLQAQEFKANIADSLQTSLNAAMNSLQFEANSLTGFLSQTWNFIKEIFGGGLEDFQSAAIRDQIAAASGAGEQFSGTFIEDLVARQIGRGTGLIEALQKGQKLSNEQLEELYRGLEAQTESGRMRVLENYQTANKVWGQTQRELNAAMKQGAEGAKQMSKAYTDLERKLQPKTNFDDTVTAVDSMAEAFINMDKSVQPEFLAKILGDRAPENLKTLVETRRTIEAIKSDMDKLAAESGKDTDAYKSKALYLSQMQDSMELLKDFGLDETMNLKTQEQVSKAIYKLKYGSDIKNAQLLAQTASEKQAYYQKLIALYTNDTVHSAKQVRRLNLDILDSKIMILEAERDIIELQSGSASPAYLAATAKLRNLEMDRAKIAGNIQKKLEFQRLHSYDMNDKAADYRDELLNQLSVWDEINKSQEKFGKNNTINTTAEIQDEFINQSWRVARARMSEIAKEFGSAIRSIADSFKDALAGALESAITGAEQAPSINEVLGKSFLQQGTQMASGIVTDQLFSRSGVVGSALEGLFGKGFADTAIPQTDLEIQQRQLEYLKQIAENRGVILEGNVVAEQSKEAINKVTDSIVENTKETIEGFGGLDGIFNNLLGSNGLGGMLMSGLSSANTWLGSTFSPLDLFGFGGFFANGGIMKGGMKAYAEGGIATKPHIGVIGEGKYNEAVVPLPDGKSIPVIGNTGGATNNVTVNVSVDSNGNAQTDTQGGDNSKQLGYMIAQAVQDEIMQQQRPGGLLNTTGTRSY